MKRTIVQAIFNRSQIFRYLVVGVVNTAFGYSLYALFIFLGLEYQLANLLSLIFGIFFSFKTQGRFVFHDSDSRRIWRYILVWALVYGVVTFLIGKIMALGYSAYVAGAATLPVSVLLSFTAQRFFVFRSRARQP